MKQRDISLSLATIVVLALIAFPVVTVLPPASTAAPHSELGEGETRGYGNTDTSTLSRSHPNTQPQTGFELLATFIGEAAGDNLGRGVANGDLNSDGYNDLAVRAHLNDEAGTDAGKVYVYLGPSLTLHTMLLGENAGDQFGHPIDNAGDLNGDGHDDLVVGALYYDDSSGNADVGRVYVYWGGPSLDNVADLMMTGDQAVRPGGHAPLFGTSVVGLGDINGDGYDDLAISDRSDVGGFDRGRVYIYYGGPDVDDIPDMTIPPQGSNIFGYVMIGAGDVNGDGYVDMLVSSYDSRNGRVYLYFGGPGMDTSPDATFDEGGSGEIFFGTSDLAGADVNNDGYSDIVIGACGIGSGRVFIYYGGESVDSVADVVLQGENSGDCFGGNDITSLGDVNGDGYEDIAAQASRNDEGGIDAGKVYVYFGGDPMDTTADITLIGEAAGDHFGQLNSGDLTSDGMRELVVGVSSNDEGGTNAGKVYIYRLARQSKVYLPLVMNDYIHYPPCDQFDGEPLDDRWTWVDLNGNDSWSLTANPGYLRITTPYLYDNPLADIGRMTQQVSGDFQAETSVTMVDSRNSFQQTGVLLWHDADNHLSYHRTYSYRDYLQVLWMDNGVPGAAEIVGFGANPTYLRVTRIGADFTLFYSSDGTVWEEWRTVQLGLSSELEIGLFARYGNNNFGPTFSADFDYFCLSPN